jgi:signal peptidase I
MSTAESTGRKPWVAVALALFSTGLGHIYCGRIVTGLVLFLIVLLFAPLVVLAAHLAPSTAVLCGLLTAGAVAVGAILYGIGDAYWAARRSRELYQLKEYNRGGLYALFILVGVTYPVGIVAYVRTHVFEAFYIPTRSMAPNILEGDHVLVNKTVFQLRFPQRGDLVVFRVPEKPGMHWIKRVIAVPGDKIAVRGSDVFLNGQRLPRDPVPTASLADIRSQVEGRVSEEINTGHRYLILLAPGDGPKTSFQETTVPERACFVLGDNRNLSSDSRDLGFIPLENLVGVVQYIYWPAETWNRFGAYQDW